MPTRRTILHGATVSLGLLTTKGQAFPVQDGGSPPEPAPSNPDQPPAIENLNAGVFKRRIGPDTFFRSGRVDFVQIPSTVTPGVMIAAAIYRPDRPGPVLLKSHGWHGSVVRPTPTSANPNPGFLTIELDMRGRSYSSGMPDANGLELYDFHDALSFVRRMYGDSIADPDRVHFQGGSGGGGNALAIAAKFPDLFASIVAAYPISDYAAWYQQDGIGEFRDEMDVWIGKSPTEAPEAYAARSGLTGVPNILTPMTLMHGETDVRVPASHSRLFVRAMQILRKDVTYLEMPGVGTRDHLGNITPALRTRMAMATQRALTIHRTAPVLPRRGVLVVPGFVRTKRFAVMMDTIDAVGLVAYDLDRDEVILLKGAGRIERLQR